MNIESNQANLVTKEGVTFVEFPILKQFSFIRHGFSTKLGGVSEGIFESMNLNNRNAPYPDSDNNIKENFRRFAKAIDVIPEKMVLSHQVHKTNLKIITEKDAGKGIFCERNYSEIDGLITNEPGLTLVTQYADCVPLYFVDPEKKVIALTHSGWRGTVEKIGALTVDKMCSTFYCRKENIIAVIGPSICKDCFEIGEEVADKFIEAFDGNELLASIITKGRQEKDKNDKIIQKYNCDLWLANKMVLLESGLLGKNICVSGVCTCCHSDLFFSHRKVGFSRGSLAAFLSFI